MNEKFSSLLTSFAGQDWFRFSEEQRTEIYNRCVELGDLLCEEVAVILRWLRFKIRQKLGEGKREAQIRREMDICYLCVVIYHGPVSLFDQVFLEPRSTLIIFLIQLWQWAKEDLIP